MSKLLLSIFGACMVCGCTSYTGLVTPGDDIVDESNLPFAQKAAQDYAARQQFRRPVVIQESEGVNFFLSPNYVPRSNNARANALCQSIDTRRALLQSAKATLRSIVHNLKDLELTGEGSSGLVNVSVDSKTPQSVYRLTYNIVNIDLQLREAIWGLVRVASSSSNKIAYEWVANASIEVRLIDPNGNEVFTFNSMGTLTQTDDGSLNPNMTMLEQAASKGVTDAMKQYALKFGPPIYVTDTCQNGEFARINVGGDYGVQPGMRVEFFRHREKRSLGGNTEMVEQRVGTGVVGKCGATVEPGCAWVYVEDYDKDARTVFQWTSAKLLEGSCSTGNFTIPGMN